LKPKNDLPIDLLSYRAAAGPAASTLRAASQMSGIRDRSAFAEIFALRFECR
jgi:hypothetical protein